MLQSIESFYRNREVLSFS